MADTHLTMDELAMIEIYYHQDVKVSEMVAYLKRSKQTLYNAIHFLKEGHTALEYHQRYKENKKHCGRRKIICPGTTSIHQGKSGAWMDIRYHHRPERGDHRLFCTHPLPAVQGENIR